MISTCQASEEVLVTFFFVHCLVCLTCYTNRKKERGLLNYLWVPYQRRFVRDLNGTLSFKKWHGWQMILRRCGVLDLSDLILSNQIKIMLFMDCHAGYY